MKNFLLAFIPIFVAVDAIGVLPIYVSLTEGLEKETQKKIITQSIITALTLAFFFILLGKAVFKLLGVTIADFMVAGGIILFSIAIIDLLHPGKRRRIPADDLGAVPLGTPLIVGPAVLTTSLIIIDQYGIPATIISVTINVLLAGIVFWHAEILTRIFGQAGSRALTKIMALMLSAIAIKMIRKGLLEIAVTWGNW